MKILFFDGYCSLCNNLIDWLIRHDTKNVLQFSSLQGETAKTQLPSAYRIPANTKGGEGSGGDVDTVIYLSNGKIYQRSRAILHVFQDLGFPWAMLGVFLILPSFTLDWGYRIVAKYRYKWFGKKETCRIPTPAEKQKILP